MAQTADRVYTDRFNRLITMSPSSQLVVHGDGAEAGAAALLAAGTGQEQLEWRLNMEKAGDNLTCHGGLCTCEADKASFLDIDLIKC